MVISTILSIYLPFNLMIVSGDVFWVESGGSIQFGVAREAANINVIPPDQLLPNFLRSVTVGFATCLESLRAFSTEVLQLCSHPVIDWPDALPGVFGLWFTQVAAICGGRHPAGSGVVLALFIPQRRGVAGRADLHANHVVPEP